MSQPLATAGGWTGFHPAHDTGGAEASCAVQPLDILDTLDVPVVVARRDLTIACFNRAVVDVLGLEPADIGRKLSAIAGLAALRDLETSCAQAIANEAPSRHDFREPKRSFVLRIAPCAGRTGEISGVVLSFTNVTAFRASLEQALYEREYTKAILNTVDDPLAVLSAEQRVQTANRAFHTLLDLPREKTQDASLAELANRAFDDPRLRAQLQETLADGRDFAPLEIECDLPGGRRVFTLNARPLPATGRAGRLVLLVLHDITERKRGETHRDLLLQELDHRVKNTLASVQSMAVQTLHGSADPRAFYATFEARLLALARAHTLLAQEGWQGAGLRVLIETTFAPYDDEARRRCSLSGEDIQLPSQTALALARGLHELATNAAKYGALSVPTGRVAVSWRMEGDHLHLTWVESGGPPVKPPERRGFGSRLIEKGLALELSCEVGLDFDPAGLRCTIVVPLTPKDTRE